jgi:hypothetical protein
MFVFEQNQISRYLKSRFLGQNAAYGGPIKFGKLLGNAR